MGGAKIFLEGNGAHGSGDEHIASGFDIGGVFYGGFEILGDEFDSFEGDGIAHGVEILDGEGFDVVGEGVHAGGGGEVSR